MAATGGTQIVNAFQLSSKRFLDLRQHCSTVEELKATSENSIPDGYTKYVEETRSWYTWDSHNTETEETGKWRKSVPIDETLSEEYIYAIVDKDDTLLFGIRFDGEVVYNKGMSDEVRMRFNELKGIQPMSDETYIYAILDSAGKLLFGIRRDGAVVYDRGIPTEVQKRFDELEGYQIMQDENYIFAIVDKHTEYVLFGIDHKGRIVYDKGIPGEVQKRFDELKGYQIMHSENFLFALTDNLGNVLIGIENDGHAVIPRGIVELVTWDEYNSRKHHKDTLYIIKGKSGMTEGAYINDMPINTGEEYAFFREGNLIMYKGTMHSIPRLRIDHENMELTVDYPSDYSGPMIICDKDTKTLFMI